MLQSLQHFLYITTFAHEQEKCSTLWNNLSTVNTTASCVLAAPAWLWVAAPELPVTGAHVAAAGAPSPRAFWKASAAWGSASAVTRRLWIRGSALRWSPGRTHQVMLKFRSSGAAPRRRESRRVHTRALLPRSGFPGQRQSAEYTETPGDMSI